MITRHYFYSFKWNHIDGNNSYSYDTGTAAYKSWLPKSEYVFHEIKSRFVNKIQPKFKGGSFEAISFNRV